MREARFVDGVESMPVGFMLWDASDRLVAWNARVLAMWPKAIDLLRPGVAFEACIGETIRRTWPDLPAAELRLRIAERIERHAACNAAWIGEMPDGRFFQFSEARTSEGGVVSLCADVTEPQRALRDLAASEARFRDGIENMADGFTLWDAEDRLITWNTGFAVIAPIEAEVLREGIGFRECIDHLEARLGARAPGWDWRGYLAKRRARRSALGTSLEVTNIHGTVVEIIEQPTSEGGVVSIYRDVTDARRAARRLAESELRLHDFAEAASDWFWETGPDDRFTFVSSGIRKIGVDPAALIGRSRGEHAGDMGGEPGEDLLALDRMVANRETIRDFCHEIAVDRQGGRRSVEIHAKPLFDPAGVFRGYRGTGRDVTQRDQQRRELARALAAEREMNAQQRRFVSMASHEFRTPLAVIDSATQRLMAQAAGGDLEMAKRLDRIRGAVSRMTELIDRTLSSARLDEGRIELQPRWLDVGALLREVIERQSQISRQHRIALSAPGGDCPIEGDPKLLEQVFANLVSNAVKYSGRSREIEVLLDSDPASARIAVRDRGLGIPAAELPQLFTRFFRASTAMGIPGTGIGLHLVRELVEMHGGTVQVASTPGEGSTFTVSLPRRRPRAPVA
jgi:PAS domain S-box-containing protein